MEEGRVMTTSSSVRKEQEVKNMKDSRNNKILFILYKEGNPAFCKLFSYAFSNHPGKSSSFQEGCPVLHCFYNLHMSKEKIHSLYDGT